MNKQEAPFPIVLEALVGQLNYKQSAGWRYWLVDMDRGQGSKGLTLIIQRSGPDTYHPEQNIKVSHYFPVPPASYDMRSWRRWLFEQLHLVELHELMENFIFVDSFGVEHRPYAPSHGPGNDPYLVREVGTEEDQRTSFLGELKPRYDDGVSGDSHLTPNLRRQTNESRALDEAAGPL